METFATWLYVKYVAMPAIKDGSTIKLTVMTEEETEEYLAKSEWDQNPKNERNAMYEKLFDTEQ